MSSANLGPLEGAIELVQIAIEEDKKQNYPEAYKQHQNALDNFTLASALKCLFLLRSAGTHAENYCEWDLNP
ncbi:hypothetical protein EDB84DRAFT_1556929 [Lactarius hengduanensis]|nr:hypothetical protein EDB84DRAFT_1556929 [Lactarius hengduanensis]